MTRAEAIQQAREAIPCNQHGEDVPVWILRDLLAALDAEAPPAAVPASDPPVMNLISKYWDLAYTAGVSQSDAANEVLHQIRRALAPPAAVPAPSAEDAQRMGEQGGPAVESERLAFEAWMRGHCWALGAVWSGKGYIGMNEEDGFVCPQATRTRGLWAAWRDRAALAPPAAVADGYRLVPVETLFDFKAWFSSVSPLGIHLRKRVDELLAAASKGSE